jgi:hypothetical protein
VPSSRSLALITAVVLFIAWRLSPPAGRPGPPMRDFEAYYAAGAAHDRGDDPYTRALWKTERTIEGVDPSHEELLPYVGPAVALPAYGLLAKLPYETAHRVWGGLLGLMLGVALFGMLYLFEARPGWETLAGSLVLCNAFGPLTSDVALGQVALVGFAGIVIAAVALRLRHTVGAAIGAIIAAAQPNLALILLARLREKRSLIAFALAFAVFVAATLVASGGVSGTLRYLELLREHGAVERFLAIQITPVAIAWELGASRRLAEIVGGLVSIVALTLAVVGVRRARANETRLAIACCALPFVVPFFHEHDFVVMLFPAMYLAIRARGRPLTLAAIGTSFIAVDWLGLGQRPTGIPQSLAMAFAAVCGFALLADTRDPRRFAGLVVCCLAVPAAVAAHAHPVPIWPDMLPAHFNPPPQLDASAVWHAEQASSGLEQPARLWAILKLGTFAGCAALWLALIQMSTSRKSSNGPSWWGRNPLRSELNAYRSSGIERTTVGTSRVIWSTMKSTSG